MVIDHQTLRELGATMHTCPFTFQSQLSRDLWESHFLYTVSNSGCYTRSIIKYLSYNIILLERTLRDFLGVPGKYLSVFFFEMSREGRFCDLLYWNCVFIGCRLWSDCSCQIEPIREGWGKVQGCKSAFGGFLFPPGDSRFWQRNQRGRMCLCGLVSLVDHPAHH
jgi:hypothetical protein